MSEVVGKKGSSIETVPIAFGAQVMPNSPEAYVQEGQARSPLCG